MTIKTILFAGVAVAATAGAIAVAQPLSSGANHGLADVIHQDAVGLAHGRGWGERGMFGGRRGDRGVMRAMLREADQNGDEALTQAEVDAFIAREVAAADGNDDGNLSLDEFQVIFVKFARPAMVDAFQRLDEDGDGTVTSAEREELFGRIVTRFDRNDDGQLDRSDRRRGWGHRGDRDDR